MKDKTAQSERREQSGGPLCALTVDELAHLAVLKLACEGYRSQVMGMGLVTVEAFARALITPGGITGPPARWIRETWGFDIAPSAVYRFIKRFRETASGLINQYIASSANGTQHKPFPAGVGDNRAVKPEDVTKR